MLITKDEFMNFLEQKILKDGVVIRQKGYALESLAIVESMDEANRIVNFKSM